MNRQELEKRASDTGNVGCVSLFATLVSIVVVFGAIAISHGAFSPITVFGLMLAVGCLAWFIKATRDWLDADEALFQIRRIEDHIHKDGCLKSGSIDTVDMVMKYEADYLGGAWGFGFSTPIRIETTQCSMCGSKMAWTGYTGKPTS